ncbi:MAG TPA: hypothetical protein VD995_12235 [Azospirillum sp.]|nr:hypothetical protein [Azospirillum sp.]
MRLLFVMPHHCGDGDARYGSTSGRRAARAACLRDSILSLHRTFGRGQMAIADLRRGELVHANGSAGVVVDVFVAAVPGAHCLDAADLPAGAFTPVLVDYDPAMLGLVCHGLIYKHAAAYDWICYLEDDIVITDPHFFAKLAWFGARFGSERLLLPNRYEVRDGAPGKVYIDVHASRTFARPWHKPDDGPALEAEFLGETVVFTRPNNPHAGCFALSRRQAEIWIAAPTFMDGDVSFVGPLESMATLSVMKTFRIHKPALANHSFLEVRHADPRYYGVWFQ